VSQMSDSQIGLVFAVRLYDEPFLEKIVEARFELHACTVGARCNQQSAGSRTEDVIMRCIVRAIAHLRGQ
jgi:hypothetical protein